MSSKDIVVVPRVSNLANPKGYRCDGGFRDSFQQKRVTKSPRRSVWPSSMVVKP